MVTTRSSKRIADASDARGTLLYVGAGWDTFPIRSLNSKYREFVFVDPLEDCMYHPWMDDPETRSSRPYPKRPPLRERRAFFEPRFRRRLESNHAVCEYDASKGVIAASGGCPGCGANGWRLQYHVGVAGEDLASALGPDLLARVSGLYVSGHVPCASAYSLATLPNLREVYIPTFLYEDGELCDLDPRVVVHTGSDIQYDSDSGEYFAVDTDWSGDGSEDSEENDA